MGVSNLSWNERRVKIECYKCCNIKYGHHPRADTLWCTADDFIDARCYTKKVNLTEKSFCMCFFYCRVRQPCCSYNSLAQRKTVVTALNTVRGTAVLRQANHICDTLFHITMLEKCHVARTNSGHSNLPYHPLFLTMAVIVRSRTV